MKECRGFLALWHVFHTLRRVPLISVNYESEKELYQEETKGKDEVW
jgi:hypothetical protein